MSKRCQERVKQTFLRLVLIGLVTERSCHDFNYRIAPDMDAEPMMAIRKGDSRVVVPVSEGMSILSGSVGARQNLFASELPVGESTAK